MSYFNYISIISMVLMTILILIQTRGASLGAGLGGGGGEVNTVRRGSDKTIHQLTIILAIIFAASLLLGIIVV
jgi:preprotein translocase subunit SecG